MDVLSMHEIAEAGHRILNPFTEDKLMLLGEVCRLHPGQRLLDLASGKGELLCRWADAFGIEGLGVDISTVFVPAARARAVELGVADRVTFALGDAAQAVPPPGGAGDATRPPAAETGGAGPRWEYDVVSCIGATWIGGGLAGTVALMRRAVREDGLLLLGEPYWADDTPDGAYAALDCPRDVFATLGGTLERLESAGLELLEMVLADGDSWDRYVASQWWTVSDWLRAHPESPDAPAMREYLRAARRTHLQYQRRYLGWGVFVCRVSGA
ncbi:SAM-dependent methyltransferase [Dactylosporangium matsuzakiense]|nr:class I SAM-dependent methyltransferase [Dactylosporangium matsuzakiense]UWZ49005.1 methyltransferase domain-containing protein [Dactylosporangium matsuzakiense]